MTRHGLIWILAIITIFLFAPLVVTHQDYEACVAKELTEASGWYNAEEVQAILDRTNNLYDLIMVRPGLDPAIRRYFVKPVTAKEVLPGVAMPKAISPYANHLVEYGGNLLYNIWIFCFRLAHSWSWIVYLTPFLLAVTFDGLMTRKVKLASFKYTSPTIYNLSWHIIIAMAAISLVAFAVILPLTVFLYPIILTLMGMFVRLIISNVQHSA